MDAALARDRELSAEAGQLCDIRQALKADDDVMSPGEFGLARLRRAIDAEQMQRRRARLAWVSALTASVAAVGLTFVFWHPSPEGEAPAYVQASGDEPANTLTVMFQPTATEAAIAALLRAHDLVIVDGPSALGLYRLSAKADTALAGLEASLRTEATVIKTVTPAE